MSSFIVMGFLQVGHLLCMRIAVVIQALQNMWPHFVDISSTTGPIQIGHVSVGSFGGKGGFVTFSPCQKNNTISIQPQTHMQVQEHKHA